MSDRRGFSPRLLAHEEAQNPDALERIALAKRRIQSILDRETVAHQKTLEQKIGDQGPVHQHSGSGFGNLTGDALEVVVFKALDRIFQSDPRFAYQGHFDLNHPKTRQGRYRKTQPPKTIGRRTTRKEADFLQFGHTAGPLCIECKNYREWIYPHHHVIGELIVKAFELGALPVLICRRFHYTTIRNLLEPAGIIAHESLFQYYTVDQSEIAVKVKHARSLGFTDVTASEEPHPRTIQFFTNNLPSVVERMAERWHANKVNLFDYAQGQLNLAQLYTAIDSPAGGKWQDF